MKIPLRFQITEYDCGATGLLNAFSYLFNREEIPPELVREISLYTLDTEDQEGNLGIGGTSREAVHNLVKWISYYAQEYDFGVDCKYYQKEEVTVDVIEHCVMHGGCVFLRTYQDCEHYVIVTKMDENNAYLFDSYYFDEHYYDPDQMVTIVFDHPFEYNRIVDLKRFNSDSKKDFALGPIAGRECVCMIKRDQN